MGYILQSTPEMGEYGVEVRRESFYLHGEDAFEHNFNGAPAPRHAIIVYPSMGPTKTASVGSIELLIEDIPKIRAALDVVERYLEGERA